MSIQDFLNYRETQLSYIPPTPEEAISKPYTVLNYGMYGYYFSSLEYYTIDNLIKAKNAMLNLLNKIQAVEQEKEDKFFRQYRLQIQQKDKEFENTFNRLYSANEYSKLMTAIEQRRRGLYNLSNSLNENLQKFQNQWYETQNKAFKQAIEDVVQRSGRRKKGDRLWMYEEQGEKALEITFNEILNQAEKYFFDSVEQELDEIYKQELKNVWQKFKSLFTKHLQNSKYGSFNEFDSLKRFRDAVAPEKLKEKQKKGKTKAKTVEEFWGNKNKTAKQFASDIFFDLFLNGVSAELYLDLNKGTIRTGEVKHRGKSIKSDTIGIFSGDLELEADFQDVIQKIVEKEGNNVYQELKSALELYDEDNFIIHYSAKDLSKRSTERRVSIQGSASLTNRIIELQQIASMVETGNIESLIFAIANAGSGGAMEGEVSDIKEAITALCATWMFEDYEDTFRQIQTGVTNNHLHIYFINGNYYTVSEILGLTIKQLSNKEPRDLVKVSFNPSKTDPYEKVNHDRKIKGIPRWEYVRNENFKRGTLSIRMNTRVLEDILLNL